LLTKGRKILTERFVRTVSFCLLTMIITSMIIKDDKISNHCEQIKAHSAHKISQ